MYVENESRNPTSLAATLLLAGFIMVAGVPPERRPRLPCRYGAKPDERVRIELVEAGIESGFRLIDMLEFCPAEKPRLMADAERVYADVLLRMERLTPAERGCFQPLVSELRRNIDRASNPHLTV